MRASFSFIVVTRMQEANTVGDTIPIQETYHILKGDDKLPKISIRKLWYKNCKISDITRHIISFKGVPHLTLFAVTEAIKMST